MSRSQGRDRGETPARLGSASAGDEEIRRPGPIEALLQEVIRRAAAVGFSSFFLTEEAIRRAFSDAVPPDWVDYVSRQGEEVRRDIVDRLGREFGTWLRTQDLPRILGRFLEEYDVSATIDVTAKPRASGKETSLQVVSRRK